MMRATGIVYTPKDTEDFENRCRMAARDAGVTPIDGPVSLRISAYWPTKSPLKRGLRPELPKYTKPDWDNVGKAVSDALEGIAYRNDSQVADGFVRKRYAEQGQPARVEVTISAI